MDFSVCLLNLTPEEIDALLQLVNSKVDISKKNDQGVTALAAMATRTDANIGFIKIFKLLSARLACQHPKFLVPDANSRRMALHHGINLLLGSSVGARAKSQSLCAALEDLVRHENATHPPMFASSCNDSDTFLRDHLSFLLRNFSKGTPGVEIPPRLAVSAKQIAKDIEREVIEVNGIVFKDHCDMDRYGVDAVKLFLAEQIESTVMTPVVETEPLDESAKSARNGGKVPSNARTQQLVEWILQASNRTVHGGDSYFISSCLLNSPYGSHAVLVTPDPRHRCMPSTVLTTKEEILVSNRTAYVVHLPDAAPLAFKVTILERLCFVESAIRAVAETIAPRSRYVKIEPGDIMLRPSPAPTKAKAGQTTWICPNSNCLRTFASVDLLKRHAATCTRARTASASNSSSDRIKITRPENVQRRGTFAVLEELGIDTTYLPTNDMGRKTSNAPGPKDTRRRGMRLSAHNALAEGREYHLAEDELSAAAARLASARRKLQEASSALEIAQQYAAASMSDFCPEFKKKAFAKSCRLCGRNEQKCASSRVVKDSACVKLRQQTDVHRHALCANDRAAAELKAYLHRSRFGESKFKFYLPDSLGFEISNEIRPMRVIKFCSAPGGGMGQAQRLGVRIGDCISRVNGRDCLSLVIQDFNILLDRSPDALELCFVRDQQDPLVSATPVSVPTASTTAVNEHVSSSDDSDTTDEL